MKGTAIFPHIDEILKIAIVFGNPLATMLING